MNRIFLRPLKEEDINENYLSWFDDEEVTRFLEVRGNSLTREKVIEHLNLGLETKSYYIYAICLNENKEHIGNLKIGPIDERHKVSDLVTVIGDRKYWGQGYGSEAIRLGIELAFEKHDIRKLHASIYSDNENSKKAYTSAGFKIEAVLKNQFILHGKYLDQILVSCFNPKFHKNGIDSSMNL